jgi:hypothetical protein
MNRTSMLTCLALMLSLPLAVDKGLAQDVPQPSAAPTGTPDIQQPVPTGTPDLQQSPATPQGGTTEAVPSNPNEKVESESSSATTTSDAITGKVVSVVGGVVTLETADGKLVAISVPRYEVTRLSQAVGKTVSYSDGQFSTVTTVASASIASSSTSASSGASGSSSLEQSSSSSVTRSEVQTESQVKPVAPVPEPASPPPVAAPAPADIVPQAW